MNGWYDPDNLLDVLDHLLLALAGIAVVSIPSWFAARNHRGINDIKNQVVNGHTSPLRADLDRALHAIEALGRDVAAIRHDLQLEQTSRHSQINDLREDVDRMRRR